MPASRGGPLAAILRPCESYGQDVRHTSRRTGNCVRDDVVAADGKPLPEYPRVQLARVGDLGCHYARIVEPGVPESERQRVIYTDQLD